MNTADRGFKGVSPKFGFFRGFWSAVWRALLEADRINEVRWNLLLAISLRGQKRASDNALQTRRRLSGRC
jgi:hypothetical protein